MRVDQLGATSTNFGLICGTVCSGSARFGTIPTGLSGASAVCPGSIYASTEGRPKSSQPRRLRRAQHAMQRSWSTKAADSEFWGKAISQQIESVLLGGRRALTAPGHCRPRRLCPVRLGRLRWGSFEEVGQRGRIWPGATERASFLCLNESGRAGSWERGRKPVGSMARWLDGSTLALAHRRRTAK